VLRSLPPAGHQIDAVTAFRCLTAPAAPASGFLPCAEFEGAVLTRSGTAALTLALQALGKLRSGSEVILPAYTCPSVAAAVIKAGLRPVLCDVRPDSFLMDPAWLEARIGDDTLAIIPVHLFGIPEDLRTIRKLADQNGIALVEDATQAYGNTCDGDPVGAIGDLGVFSFGRGKPLSLMTGGALVVNRAELREAIDRPGLATPSMRYKLMLLLYAIFFNPRLFWIPAGLPGLRLGDTYFTLDIDLSGPEPAMYRIGNELHAAWERIRARRLELSKIYRDVLSGVPTCSLPGSDRDDPGTALLRFPILAADGRERDGILTAMKKEGLGATGMYPVPLNRLPGLSEYFPKDEFYPEAQSISERLITLPLHEHVTERDIDSIRRIVADR
jgi:dTDP-4-amino-4,6-dideoxygalactose transaminase